MTGQELVVVLDRLPDVLIRDDPGNVGTLIRAADAVGAAAVILIKPCADVFDPKAVRSSMGSLFNVPLVRTGDVAALSGWLRHSGLRLVGADVHQGIPWGWGLWEGGVALVADGYIRWVTRRAASRRTCAFTWRAWPGCRWWAEPNRSTSP